MLAMGEREAFPELPPPPSKSDSKARPASGHEPDNALPDSHRHGEALRHVVPPDVVLRIRAAAESGDATAQGMLGEMYHEGKGVERDLRNAFYWFRLGAEQEDPTSMLYLARYFKGEFPELKIDKDFDEAEKWLQKLARQGDVGAMGTLGALLFERVRQGEENRKEEAIWWYNRATGGPWDENYVPPKWHEDEPDMHDVTEKQASE